jgi:hypothetical protein
MVKVLVIGYVPDAVDFTDPVLPPGMDVGVVAAGLQRDAQKMRDRGWEGEHLLIRPNENIPERILDHLNGRRYDCIVIGAGIRLTTKHVPEFEQVIKAVRHGAPQTPIAFNFSPDSSGEAAARWL